MLNQVRTLGIEYVHDLIFIKFTSLQGEKAYGAFIMTASHKDKGACAVKGGRIWGARTAKGRVRAHP
jgi:hypothetical protein